MVGEGIGGELRVVGGRGIEVVGTAGRVTVGGDRTMLLENGVAYKLEERDSVLRFFRSARLERIVAPQVTKRRVPFAYGTHTFVDVHICFFLCFG